MNIKEEPHKVKISQVDLIYVVINVYKSSERYGLKRELM